MKRLLWLFFFTLTTSFLLSAQTSFPERCEGTWEGMMHIYRQGQLVDSVQIIFTAAQTEEANTWTWKTQYISEKYPMTKDYQLKIDDSEKGYYLLDEGDGVVLRDYGFGDKIYSVFEVQGILLTSSYELQGDHLIFEVSSGKKIAPAEGQQVINYSVDNLQRVVLSKQ